MSNVIPTLWHLFIQCNLYIFTQTRILGSFYWKCKKNVKSHLMAVFRCWISSLSLWASSCSWALSCCILLIYSAVFCSVVALLICASRNGDYHMSATPTILHTNLVWLWLYSEILDAFTFHTVINSASHPLFLYLLHHCVSLYSTFMLGWELSVVTSLCKVSKPSLMLNRRFCSAEMWVILLVSICCRCKRHNDTVSAFLHKLNACTLK